MDDQPSTPSDATLARGGATTLRRRKRGPAAFRSLAVLVSLVVIGAVVSTPTAAGADVSADIDATAQHAALLEALDALASLPDPDPSSDAPLTPLAWKPELRTASSESLRAVLAASSTSELLTAAKALGADEATRAELLSMAGWGDVAVAAIIAVGSTMAVAACSTTPCALAAATIAVGAWLYTAGEAQDAARETCGERTLHYYDPVAEESYCYDPCEARHWNC